MSKSWNKYPTFHVIFPLGKDQFKIKGFTRDIGDNYVSTFSISTKFWFMKNGWKI